ncbi:hypothetical protein MLD38_026596 [Melastoma candidum]|uniref:Uncharacterized protein n=1 Tax=Melastoma candidum TaxID=119954 RepID=A0ACB9P1Z9_9MYRT|nr:hypothetical protein MLD38_026596 [Melastoma candidum]
MDAGKSYDFSRCVSSNAGMSSLETGHHTLTKNDEKLVVDQTSSWIDRRVAVSDLVWCKDIGQPWWPGKVIGDSMMLSDRDESFNSDVYLVVCFGDGSARWRGVACIKPFWENFSRLAEQSDTEIFGQAVDCALEEVSRRIKYTLTCSCMPKQICVDVGRPFWGLGSDDKQEVVLSTSSFVPQELVNYLRASSVAASGCDNRLVPEVMIAQLSAFFCWRTHSHELPRYSSFLALDGDSSDIFSVRSVQNSNDIMDFYGQDVSASGGSFPVSQNTWFEAGCAAYGKVLIDSKYPGDISTPIISAASLGTCVTESEEKKYAFSLHMFFTDWNTVPSETRLHETFGQFGQLIESETKLYPKSTAARIVFLERSAAEAAFGIVRGTLPSVVSFKLKPLRLKPVKSSRGRKRQR